MQCPPASPLVEYCQTTGSDAGRSAVDSTCAGKAAAAATNRTALRISGGRGRTAQPHVIEGRLAKKWQYVNDFQQGVGARFDCAFRRPICRTDCFGSCFHRGPWTGEQDLWGFGAEFPGPFETGAGNRSTTFIRHHPPHSRNRSGRAQRLTARRPWDAGPAMPLRCIPGADLRRPPEPTCEESGFRNGRGQEAGGRGMLV